VHAQFAAPTIKTTVDIPNFSWPNIIDLFSS
jgi:hypothetical protein